VNSLAPTLATPAALVAVPLAAILASAGVRTWTARLVTVLAAALGLWWVLGRGDLPDQTVRAALVMTTIAYAVATRLTRWTVTHRALFAITVGAVGTVLGFVALGWSWDRLRWWIEFRTGPSLRLILGSIAQATPGDPGPAASMTPGSMAEFEEMLGRVVHTTAEVFPSALALQVLGGLVVAQAIADRVARVPVGRPLGRLVDFRFNEHLGWVLAAALVALLLPGLGPVRPVAVNLLVVMGALYTFRGLAVVAYWLRAVRGGVLLYVAAALALIFLLPGVILLGVMDAGRDLRRRTPPPQGA
jgi:hypothetical protein